MDEQRLEEIAKSLVTSLRDLDCDEYGELDRRTAQPLTVAAIREALSSQEEELRKLTQQFEAMRTERDRLCEQAANDLVKIGQQEEELRSLREERDALSAQLRNVGVVPYLDRMKELAAARDAAEAALQRLREVFVSARDHLRKRHGCDNFDAFDVEKCEWLTVEHDFEVASSVEEKSTKASDVLGTMDSEGPLLHSPGVPQKGQ